MLDYDDGPMTWDANDTARDDKQSELFRHHVKDDDPTLILPTTDRAALVRAAVDAHLPFEEFHSEDLED